MRLAGVPLQNGLYAAAATLRLAQVRPQIPLASTT
jgi:hypothetical protein